MNGYLACWKKFAVFTGRSSRNEFWSWFLINFAIGIGFQIIFSVIGGANATTGEDGQMMMTPSPVGMGVFIVWGLYSLLVILPWIGVSVRRLHDQDKSGMWFLLIFACGIGGLILLVMQALPGTQGENRFGTPPAS